MRQFQSEISCGGLADEIAGMVGGLVTSAAGGIINAVKFQATNDFIDKYSKDTSQIFKKRNKE